MSCTAAETLSPVSDGAAFSVGSQFEDTLFVSFGRRRRNSGGHHSIETFVLRSQSSIWAAEDVQCVWHCSVSGTEELLMAVSHGIGGE